MKILITEEQLRILLEQKVTVDSIADGLWTSVSGPGTNEENFYRFLGQIKDKNTLNLVSKKLKDKYKEDLYQIINNSNLTVAEFTVAEKNKIISILNANKLPHTLDDKGYVVVDKAANFLDPTTLNPSNKLFNFLKKEEGKKGEPVLIAYKKPGDVLTIGYGHTKGVREGMKITKETAIKLLIEDMNDAADCVRRIFKRWKAKNINVTITQSMFDTLTSLVFNSGCGSLNGDSVKKDDVIDYVRTKKFGMAAQRIKTFNIAKAKEGFSGLIPRRERESKMFCEQGGCGSVGTT